MDLLTQTADAIGIVGVVILLIAYFLLSTNKMSSQSLNYQLSNLIGAACILYSLFFNFNLASFLIETAWVIISIIGLYRIRSAAALEQKKSEANNIYQFSEIKRNQVVTKKIKENDPFN
jgi:hypothetical protein